MSADALNPVSAPCASAAGEAAAGGPTPATPAVAPPAPLAPAVRLEVGQPAPDFTLPAYPGEPICLSQFRGRKNVILYFYPRDNTPGCTREACDFRDNLERLAAADTVVLGVSSDGLAAHQKFAGDFNLTFPLLVDADHAVAERYGAWGEKVLYGKTSLGLIRSTFLIDKQGAIAAIWRHVKVDGHVEAVAQRLASLTGTSLPAAPAAPPSPAPPSAAPARSQAATPPAIRKPLKAATPAKKASGRLQSPAPLKKGVKNSAAKKTGVKKTAVKKTAAKKTPTKKKPATAAKKLTKQAISKKSVQKKPVSKTLTSKKAPAKKKSAGKKSKK